VSDSVAITAAVKSLAFEQVPEGHWASTDGHIGIVPSAGAGAFVGWWDVAWLSPGESVSVVRNVRHLPAAFLEWPETALTAAAAEARADRAAAVCVCVRCGIEFVPGAMHDERLCHGCAVEELGVVY
jgi:hypothetical protein